MKNGRVKLFEKTIVINPEDISTGPSIDGITQCFERSPTFADNSSLGKMRDCYLFDLFNLRRAHVLVQREENIDELLYIFILGLWTEAVENRLFNSDRRILILETLRDFFDVQYSLIIENKKHRVVIQKETAGKTYVIFVLRKKLERFICTLSGQLTGILLEDPELGLDRIGSHTEEKLIGNIHSICNGDDRMDNVKRQVARFELARAKLAGLGVEKTITQRVNLGVFHSGEATGLTRCFKALLRFLLPSC
jgi:hypothetical protein